jgi:hypothetical protein
MTPSVTIETREWTGAIVAATSTSARAFAIMPSIAHPARKPRNMLEIVNITSDLY